MLFMNEYEVEDALRRFSGHPVLGPASRTLANLVDWTNRNSDGWAYWPKPCRAAKALQELFPRRWDDDTDEEYLAEQYRRALRPIKAFRTRQAADFVIVEVAS